MQLNLSKMYVYGGRRFGPGPTDLPDDSDVLKALAGKEGVSLEPVPPVVVPEPVAPVVPAEPVPPVVPVASEPKFGGKPLSYYDGKTDDEILNDPDANVAEATLKKIRAAQQKQAQ